ncbi:Hypothetical predicted protein [Mytilus galloprovincialis]|nr:Hypothetical predicted protein [Mytilus galloprovincialis]
MGIQKRNADLAEINGANDDFAVDSLMNFLRKRWSIGSDNKGNYNQANNNNDIGNSYEENNKNTHVAGIGNIGDFGKKRDWSGEDKRWSIGSSNTGNGNQANNNNDIGNSHVQKNKNTHVAGIGNIGDFGKKRDWSSEDKRWSIGSSNKGNGNQANNNNDIGNSHVENNKNTHVAGIGNIGDFGKKRDWSNEDKRWSIGSSNTGDGNQANNNNDIGNSHVEKNKNTHVAGIGNIGDFGKKRDWSSEDKRWSIGSSNKGNGNQASNNNDIGNSHVEKNKNTHVAGIGNIGDFGKKRDWSNEDKRWSIGSGNKGNGNQANNNKNIGNSHVENNKHTHVAGIGNIGDFGKKRGWSNEDKRWSIGSSNKGNGNQANNNNDIGNSHVENNKNTHVAGIGNIGDFGKKRDWSNEDKR